MNLCYDCNKSINISINYIGIKPKCKCCIRRPKPINGSIIYLDNDDYKLYLNNKLEFKGEHYENKFNYNNGILDIYDFKFKKFSTLTVLYYQIENLSKVNKMINIKLYLFDFEGNKIELFYYGISRYIKKRKYEVVSCKTLNGKFITVSKKLINMYSHIQKMRHILFEMLKKINTET